MKVSLKVWRKLVWLLVATAGTLGAQTPPSLENEVRNIFSYQASTAWPPPAPALAVTPSPRQFRAGTVLGGWQTARTYRAGIGLTNSGFEVPALSAGTWTNYSPAGTGWEMSGAGVTTQSTWFTPDAVSGRQGAFIQAGYVAQDVYLPSGTYIIRFKAVGRKDTRPIQIQLYLGATVVGNWPAAAFSVDEWREYAVANATVATAGTYKLKFQSVGDGLDRSTIIDDVAILPVNAQPNASLLQQATGTGVTLASASGVATALLGLASDGQYIYVNHAGTAIRVYKFDGTLVASNAVANLPNGNNEMTWARGYLYVRNGAAIYRIATRDWSSTKVNLDATYPLLTAEGWMTGSLLSTPDGRLGTVGALSGGQFTVRFYSISADGLTLTFSQDHAISETAVGDQHGFASDGTHLLRFPVGSYKSYSLATGQASYTSTWNMTNPTTGGAISNPTFATRDHVSGRWIVGDYSTNKVVLSAAATANPELLAGSSSLVAGAATILLPKGIPKNADGTAKGTEGVQLEYVRMMNPLVQRQSSFALGAAIPPPVFSASGRALSATELSTFYLPQPQAPAVAADAKYYYSPHAQQVFATQPGVVNITWVERLSGVTNLRQYVVSASPVKPVKSMYWTENGFTGPVIQIPSSRVSTVNVVYNSLFPATVAANYQRPGESAGSTTITTSSGTVTTNGSSLDLTVAKRTLWFSPQDNALHAYNAEGRVFVEFLGALQSDGVNRQFLGSEIVEVVKEIVPRSERVSVGDELLPLGGEPLIPLVVAGTTSTDAQGAFLHQAAAPGSLASVRLFAIRTTTPLYTSGVEIPSNEVLLYWLTQGDLGLLWPKYYAGYIQTWPTDLSRYSIYARSLDPSANTAVLLNSGDSPALVYQDDPTSAHAKVTNDYRFSTTVTTASPVGRSLIRYTNGSAIWFERVYSQLDTTMPDYLATPLAANVGARLAPPSGTDSWVGYIRQATGTAFNPKAYLDPFVVGLETAKQGAIIPVNALATNNTLEVWWYKKNIPAAAGFQPTYWPSVVRRYTAQWPTVSGEIVLASNAGSGDLPSLQAAGSIYTQNDRTLPGYNPNEEHALMLNGRAWALRTDLNQIATSSSPYVLVDYKEADERPAMAVFKVSAEKAIDGITFNYDAVAGSVLQAPMPLPLLPLPQKGTLPAGATDATYWSTYFATSSPWFPVTKAGYTVANHEIPRTVSADAPTATALTATQANNSAPVYGEFTWLDRKGTTWVYRGMHAGNPAAGTTAATFTMRYFYPTQPGFWFPELATQPAPGTVVPYGRLRLADSPVTGEPLAVVFKPTWPTSAPQLLIGQTLTRTKNGLPAMRGQTSAEVIYQQSIARDAAGTLKSVELFDPTRAKTYPLSATTLPALPSSAATDRNQGKTYFTRLPPHLIQRFYFDPTQGTMGSLVLKGEFKQEALGDDFLLLNVLSADDITALKELVATADTNKAKWNTAVDGLATTVQTFMEDPAKKGTFIVDKGSTVAPVRTNPTVVVGATSVATVIDDDTAVDSYALNASGGGSGYVVVSLGNGRAFTPVGEPVSLAVFKVNAPLYRGELKVVAPTNPLDEKITLQHSLDFSGKPQDYDFEWRYAPPVNGVPPVLYTFTPSTLLGNASGWAIYNQPTAAYAELRQPSKVFAGKVDTTTPTAITIRDTADTVAHGTTLPQAVMRKEFSLTTIPLKAFLSVDLNARDGAKIYLNESLVAVVNRDAASNSTATTAPAQFSPLALVYEVPAALLRTTANVLVLELYTDSDRGVGSVVNVRLEGLFETFDTSGWLAISPSATETASALNTGSIVGKVRHVIQGTSLLTLTDNYLTMRYRARLSTNAAYSSAWSKWTEPALAEGWIKRALAGINPFQQRVTDLYNNAISTDVSLVQQAGRRWEGDIALNLSNINSVGLIEIYETILRRGKMLSIEGTPPINYGAANDALLLAAGYLSDLYVIQGNEAFADAANPTIAYGADNGSSTYGDVSTSLFAFKGQLSGVIDEELALLRGRDNALQPGTQVTPVYNRLVWNYTRGISSGEAIYALNYNMRDMNADGAIDAADAAILYPQGHGDAYGHYLTALTGYYGLLANTNFSWTPRIEAVTVLGKPVSVDYFDERKFASAAVALARSARQIIDLTYRQAYSSSAIGSWSNLKDTFSKDGVSRRWGVDDWASRGGQGTYFHWLTGNSMLPAFDPDPSHQGIQIIDRTTVPELTELVAQATGIQQALNNADGKLNPLGLAEGALAFDISPASVDGGSSHFEQIYERATKALQNTVTAFNNAKNSTMILRSQSDSLAIDREAINQQERAYTNQLIDLYGTPYADDIGVGKTYVQDYAGPDLLHFFSVDMPEGFLPSKVTTFTHYTTPEFNEANPGAINGIAGTAPTITFSIDDTGTYRKPAEWVGRRRSPGQLQTAVSNLLLARMAVYQTNDDYKGEVEKLQNAVTVFNATLTRNTDLMANLKSYQGKYTALETILQALASAKYILESTAEMQTKLTDAAAASFPQTTGIIAGVAAGIVADITSAPRGAVKLAGAAAGFLLRNGIVALQLSESLTAQVRDSLVRVQEMEKESIAWKAEYAQLVFDLRETLNGIAPLAYSIDVAVRNYDQAMRDYLTLVAAGEAIQAERATFRQRSAALIQGYRTKDLAFRAFRDEALEKYKQLFDLSSQYAYLAATAYDFETGLLDTAGSSKAATFVDKIVKARSPGVLVDGVPQIGGSTTGDPGLAGALAQMNGDWSAVKSRLGFNNSDAYGTTFSLRAENYRILSGAAGDQAWRAVLLAARRDNLLDDPDAARYCLNLGLSNKLAIPGLILEFTTTISPGYNFFGQPLAGGDSTYSETSFATKIRSAGIAFTGYSGMVGPNATTNVVTAIGGSSPADPYTAYTDAAALSATPYVYLIPTGLDSMRSPVGGGTLVRTWAVRDQAIPVPFNIGGSNFATATTWSAGNSLTEAFSLRQHQAFRAVPSETVFSAGSTSTSFTNARLIGRSAWNSKWKVIIPGKTLLADPNEGLQIFIDSVKDIKLHLQTYSTAGN